MIQYVVIVEPDHLNGVTEMVTIATQTYGAAKERAAKEVAKLTKGTSARVYVCKVMDELAKAA